VEVPRWFRGGVKQSMTRSFVPRFLAAGGKLLPEIRARRLKQRANRWLIVGERSGGSHHCEVTIDADTVFLAAGAIQTPALLRRSGIRRNIGNSLRMHPTVKVVAQFPDEINDPSMGVPVHQVKEFAPRFSFGCSISSPPHLALALAHYPEAVKTLRENWRQMAVYYAMISGGKGTVRALPGYRDPLVRYQLEKQDWLDLSEGLADLGQCLLAAGARNLYPAPWPTGPKSRTELMTIHLFSSCPMGENRDRCAADSFGRVHDFKNLYIADGSLLCTAPGVNPQGSIMAIARRNALRFLGK
jgi:choline dehydrogenase-like flavoprotein